MRSITLRAPRHPHTTVNTFHKRMRDHATHTCDMAIQNLSAVYMYVPLTVTERKRRVPRAHCLRPSGERDMEPQSSRRASALPLPVGAETDAGRSCL